MQRLRKDGLPRMERIRAARGRCFGGHFPSGRCDRANFREDGRKIFRRIIPSDLSPGGFGNGVRRANIPDGGRVKYEERLQSDRGNEGCPRETLVDPAIAKVRVAGKFLWRHWSLYDRDQAGEELFGRARLFEGQAWRTKLPRRVERKSSTRPFMQMSDLKQTEWPPRDYTPGRMGFGLSGWAGEA